MYNKWHKYNDPGPVFSINFNAISRVKAFKFDCLLSSSLGLNYKYMDIRKSWCIVRFSDDVKYIILSQILSAWYSSNVF